MANGMNKNVTNGYNKNLRTAEEQDRLDRLDNLSEYDTYDRYSDVDVEAGRMNAKRDSMGRYTTEAGNMGKTTKTTSYNKTNMEAGRPANANRDAQGRYASETGHMGRNNSMDNYNAEAGTYSRTDTATSAMNKNNSRAKNTTNSSYNKTK